ncbi:MAG: AarF/UbiB family protein [Saprospiraceae bacterium]|nr:AarF/UbiB family protein [Saprospiraceae bacterium]
MNLVSFRPVRVLLAYSVALRILLSYYILFRLRRWYRPERFERQLHRLHHRNAGRIKRMIVRLNGLFIKVGQLISSMGKLMPEEYKVLLEDLQDRAPARDVRSVAATIRQELGASPEVLFSVFEAQPAASASIAQVHKAQLRTGEWVAVKVRHADIERIAQIDLAIVRRLVGIASRLFRIEGMDHLYTQLAEMVGRELDFTQERAAQDRLKTLLHQDGHLVVPEVFAALSSSSILTTRWYDGTKVSNVPALVAAGLEPGDVVARILQAFCQMIFLHGYFHADPHPGNFLVAQSGQIVLLDFGAVGKVSESFRAGIPVMIEAAIADDVDTLIAQGRTLGFLANGEEAEAIAREVFTALRTFLIDELKVSDLNLQDVDIDPFNNSLVALLRKVGMRKAASAFRIPQDWILLNRTGTLLLGLCATIDPGTNPLVIVRDYLRRHVFLHNRRSAWRIVSSILRDRAKQTVGQGLQYLQALRRSAAAAVVSGFTVVGQWIGEFI